MKHVGYGRLVSGYCGGKIPRSLPNEFFLCIAFTARRTICPVIRRTGADDTPEIYVHHLGNRRAVCAGVFIETIGIHMADKLFPLIVSEVEIDVKAIARGTIS